MKIKHKSSKFVSAILSVVMITISSTSVLAASQSQDVTAMNESVDVSLQESGEKDGLEAYVVEQVKKEKNVINAEDYLQEVPKELQEKFDNDSNIKRPASRATVTGNPGYNFPTAASGLNDKVVRAAFTNDVDYHYYSMNITAGKEYSFILTDVPYSCQYHLIIVQESTGGMLYQPVTGAGQTQEYYVSFAQSGKYYVVVAPVAGYSSSQYSLYFGDMVKSDTFNKSTGMTFSFGYIPFPGSSGWVDYATGWLYLDLRNESSIPAGSWVTDDYVYLDNSGNGGYWVGLKKYLNFANTDSIIYSQHSGLTPIQVKNDYYAAKQMIGIKGSVNVSTYFEWKPIIRFTYKYGVQPSTLWKLR